MTLQNETFNESTDTTFDGCTYFIFDKSDKVQKYLFPAAAGVLLLVVLILRGRFVGTLLHNLRLTYRLTNPTLVHILVLVVLEFHAAIVAGKRLFAGMSQQVELEVLPPQEGLAAEVALERLLVGVNLFVPPAIVLRGEAFVAELAHEQLPLLGQVALLVHLPAVAGRERLAAVAAEVRLGRDVVVALVPLQSPESLAAHVALVRLVLGMAALQVPPHVRPRVANLLTNGTGSSGDVIGRWRNPLDRRRVSQKLSVRVRVVLLHVSVDLGQPTVL